MHYVVGSALRHVAGDAIGSGGMRRGGGPLERCCCMALFANRVVVRGGRRSAGDIVRVVACGAAQFLITAPTRALYEALRLPQPVRALCDFKTILHSARPVELHAEIAQRLPWYVREWRSVKPADGVRKVEAGRLEVALHTHLKLPIGREEIRTDYR